MVKFWWKPRKVVQLQIQIQRAASLRRGPNKLGRFVQIVFVRMVSEVGRFRILLKEGFETDELELNHLRKNQTSDRVLPFTCLFLLTFMQ